MLNNTSGRRGVADGSPQTDRWSIVRAIVLGLFLAAAISAVLLVDFFDSNQVLLNAGDVNPVDILAPHDLTYDSEIRTRQAKEASAASVPDIFDPPDASVARQQEIRARQIMDYISTVREDPYATPEQKETWIAAIPDLDLSPATIGLVLALNDDEWQEAIDETVRVLVRAMQGEIEEDEVDSVRRRLPTLISTRMNDEQATVVEAIAGDLVAPNTLYNAARTEEAKQQARDETPPVPVGFQQGEIIVRGGSLVRPIDIEALEGFGLRQQAIRWEAVVGNIALAIIVTILLELIIFRLQPSIWTRGRASTITILLIAIFVALGKLMLPHADTIIPYLYPLPALAMLLTILFGPALGLSVGVIVALLGTYMAGEIPGINVYLLVGTLMGAVTLGQAERLGAFMRAGAAVALTQAITILLFGLLSPEQDLLKVTIASLVGLVGGGVAASLALAAFFLLSSLLDLVTPFQLMELSRPTHPLFRQLLLKAPGTYHHTLLVSNMAEEAAERIGGDGLLARVGTYYHDIGKTLRPYFFTENRVGHINPHERLDPRTSAQIIISHVTDGLDLAEKHKLPTAIRAFIPEHHGTGMTLAFYRMALTADQSRSAHQAHGNASASAHQAHGNASASAHQAHGNASASAHQAHGNASASTHQAHGNASASAHQAHGNASASAHQAHGNASASAHQAHGNASASAHQAHGNASASAHQNASAGRVAPAYRDQGPADQSEPVEQRQSVDEIQDDGDGAKGERQAVDQAQLATQSQSAVQSQLATQSQPATQGQITDSSVPTAESQPVDYSRPDEDRVVSQNAVAALNQDAGETPSGNGDEVKQHPVRKEDFTYPGPKPQSRETAITMLADSCEARVRSTEPASIEEMDRLIADTIKSKLDDGQLDESDLTMRDLQDIRAAFLSVLKGVFHPRVKYPEPVKVKGPDGREIEV